MIKIYELIIRWFIFAVNLFVYLSSTGWIDTSKELFTESLISLWEKQIIIQKNAIKITKKG